MEPKTRTQLEEAKAYFYAWRLVEAYNLFRRFFDRLPFKPEKEHAEYIGMFVRTLVELGKEYELKFYVAELEKLRERQSIPEVDYSLGVVFRYLDPPRLEACRELFEGIVKNPNAAHLHPKAKMMLADYYEVNDDYASARLLIDSIRTEDPSMLRLVQIWRSVILHREKKFTEAEACLTQLFETLKPETDWYAFFSAKLIMAVTLLDQRKLAESKKLVEEIKTLFAGRYFKSIQEQLRYLESRLEKEESLGSVSLFPGLNESRVHYKDVILSLKNKDPRDRLLVLLMKKGFLEKPMIVKAIYQRAYQGESDDKLIYYHIHALRKRLKAAGLPAEAILNEENGYRWVPEVEVKEGEL